jgi:chromosomal replication initiation ATPase DnaA
MSIVTHTSWELSEERRRRSIITRASRNARRTRYGSMPIPAASEEESPADDAPVKPTTWRHDLNEVALKHGVSPREILSPFRDKPIVSARYELFWRLRVERKYSFGRIGLLLDRDHSTVVYGVKRHAEKLEQTQ